MPCAACRSVTELVTRGASGALLCEECAELAALLAIAVRMAPEPVVTEVEAGPTIETRTREA